MKNVFVTGIDTAVGKTVVSAVLVQAWGTDYWKPVQAGDLDCTDTDRVRSLVTRTDVRFHREGFRLSRPMSPHAAAERDGVRIALETLVPPSPENGLVIEGAGGVLVPLNQSDLIIDLIERCHAVTIVVARNYLGSINHTLLTVEALDRRGLDLWGIVFCGEANEASESIILSQTGLPCVGRVSQLARIDAAAIRRCADGFARLTNGGLIR